MDNLEIKFAVIYINMGGKRRKTESEVGDALCKILTTKDIKLFKIYKGF